MKKSTIFTALATVALLFASRTSNAQYEQGDNLLNVGVSLGSSFGLPISIAYEYGMTDKISVGGILGYASKTDDLVLYKFNYTYILVGARGSYHFYMDNNIDAYGGITAGWNIASVGIEPNNFNIPTPAAGGFFWAFHLGGRYYFTEKLGAVAELGYGLGYLTAGLTYKF